MIKSVRTKSGNIAGLKKEDVKVVIMIKRKKVKNMIEETKYRIEILINGCRHQWYWNVNVNEVLAWFRRKWEVRYYDGRCSFIVYENDRELTNKELIDLGFIR